MTPRVDAWTRQANNDWAVAELTAEQGFHSQACYHFGQAAEKALKALLISLGSLLPYSHALNACRQPRISRAGCATTARAKAQGPQPNEQRDALSERQRSPG